MKHAFYKLIHNQEYDHINNPEKHIHWYFSTRSISGVKCRIIIVRDPVDRFLSAYSHRVLHHGDLSSKRLKNPPIKNFNYAPSLDEFINNFSIYANRKDIEWHTRPISKWVGGSLKMYTHVFSFEQIEEFEHLIASETGKPFKMRRLQKSEKGDLLFSLTPVQLQKIIDIYAKDYALLGDIYTPEMVWSRYFKAINHSSTNNHIVV